MIRGEQEWNALVLPGTTLAITQPSEAFAAGAIALVLGGLALGLSFYNRKPRTEDRA